MAFDRIPDNSAREFGRSVFQDTLRDCIVRVMRETDDKDEIVRRVCIEINSDESEFYTEDYMMRLGEDALNGFDEAMNEYRGDDCEEKVRTAVEEAITGMTMTDEQVEQQEGCDAFKSIIDDFIRGTITEDMNRTYEQVAEIVWGEISNERSELLLNAYNEQEADKSKEGFASIWCNYRGLDVKGNIIEDTYEMYTGEGLVRMIVDQIYNEIHGISNVGYEDQY